MLKSSRGGNDRLRRSILRGQTISSLRRRFAATAVRKKRKLRTSDKMGKRMKGFGRDLSHTLV